MRQTISIPKVFEGSWAEVSAQAEPFADHQVRLIILPLDNPVDSNPVKPRKIPGLIPPKIGSGSFEDIMRLMADDVTFSDEDSLLKPILENRTMRRSIIVEREIE